MIPSIASKIEQGSMTLTQTQTVLSQDEVTCPVCIKILSNAVLSSCGHSFCEPCFESLKQKKVVRLECLVCHSTLESSASPNLLLRKIIERLFPLQTNSQTAQETKTSTPYIAKMFKNKDILLFSHNFSLDEYIWSAYLAEVPLEVTTAWKEKVTSPMMAYLITYLIQNKKLNYLREILPVIDKKHLLPAAEDLINKYQKHVNAPINIKRFIILKFLNYSCLVALKKAFNALEPFVTWDKTNLCIPEPVAFLEACLKKGSVELKAKLTEYGYRNVASQLDEIYLLMTKIQDHK